MIEISLNNVKKNFGFKPVLNGFDLEVKTNERVALIGANGSGKSTVLKIINGEENINDGVVSIRKGASIGYFNQMPLEVSDDFTVRDVITMGLKNLFEIEKKLREVEEKMSKYNDEDILKCYSKLLEQFEGMGGYQVETTISKICEGFKIRSEMMDRKFNSLSGGEKTIVQLASLMVSNPSLLLLDEPTNHLDIDTLEWFEEYLKSYNGTVLIVSHDRYFLDKVAQKTVLIERGKSEEFYGNYSYYIEENERRIMSEFEKYKDQQKLIEAMKAKIKQLYEFGRLASPGGESFYKRAASIQKRLDKIELFDKPLAKNEIPLDFQIKERSGKEALVASDVGIILGDKILFEEANLLVRYGEKVCIIGKNGTGKTTLIKAILGDIEPATGKLKVGSSVHIGYLPQEIRFEDDQETVLEVARQSFNGNETQLRAALNKFLFCGEEVFKRVGSLSGGEKVRLKLFELIQERANLLILDEPTNHIDINTREILENALLDYKGTLLFVSHDRYFINKLAQSILSIENREIISYCGNYDYYKEKRRQFTK